MATREPWAFLLALAAGLVIYFFAGGLIYSLFYGYQPFDPAHEGAAAFKLLFWLSYAGHVLPTVGTSTVAAQLTGARKPAVAATVGVLVAVVAWPTIQVLSYLNACEGVSYPLSAGCN